MKFRIFGEQEEKKREIFFKLIKENYILKLVACSEEGKILSGGYLLHITPKGKIKRCDVINSKFGFDLDPGGRIKLEGE